MKKSGRTCWWCTKKLIEGSHAEIKDQLGNVVRVHHTCKDAAEAEVRKTTVNVPEPASKMVDGD
jgi:hypothetical protein